MIYIYFLELLICLCSLLFSVYNTKSDNITYTHKNYIGTLFVIFLLIHIMSNAYFSDIVVYDNWYQRVATDEYGLLRFEKGYSLFSFFCHEYLQLEFNQFLALYVGIILLLILLAYKSVADNFCFFIFFFMLYEIFFSGIQLRNFAATGFVVYGLTLLGKKGIKGIIMYVACVLLATLFHASSIIYIILLLCKIDFEKLIGHLKKNKIITSGVTLFLVSLLIYLERQGAFYKMVIYVSKGLNQDTVRRIGTHSSGLGFTGPMYISILYLMYLFLIYYMDKKSYISKNVYKKKLLVKNGKVTRGFWAVNVEYFFGIAKRVNMVAILFLPFVFLSTTYYRLIRTVCLFDLVFFGALFDSCQEKNKKILIFSATFILIMLWVVYDLIWPGRFSSHILGYLGGMK